MLPDLLVSLQTVQDTAALQIWILAAWDLSYLPNFFLAWAMAHFKKLISLWSSLLPTERSFSDFKHIFLPVLILVGCTECVQTSPGEKERAKGPFSPQSNVLAHLPSVVVESLWSAAHTPDKVCTTLMFAEHPRATHWTLMSFLQIFTLGGRSCLHPKSAMVAVSPCSTLELSV